MNELVIAFKNQGKSTLARYVAEQKHKPIIAYDPHEVYVDVADYVAHDIDELNDILDMELRRSDFICYTPPADDDETEFNEFIAAIWKPKHLVILIDEASYIQTAGRSPKYLLKILRLNEDKYDVDIIQASHRITDIGTVSRSQSWEWYIGFTPDGRDLDIIEEKWGETVRNAVASIKFDSHWFVHVSATMQNYELMTDSDRWYKPLVTATA